MWSTLMSRPWLQGAAALAGVVLVAGLAIFLTRPSYHPASHLQPRVAASAAPSTLAPTLAPATPIPSPTINPALPAVPATLVIPGIGVSAPIEQVTVDAQHNMATPKKPMEVGWYAPGPAPGQNGDAVIDGHLDWYGVPQAVFYNLSKLAPGDEIDVVEANGATVKFQVTDAITVPYTAHPAGLFATTGPPRLSLITCSGAWDKGKSVYTQRLIVNAKVVPATT